MDEERLQQLEQRMDYLAFRQDLLFNNSAVDRLLYEYEITQDQYRAIMDLMDKYRKMIDNKQEVSNATFETTIGEIVPQHDGNYHFCEYITRAFMEEHRWEEVFPAIYGDMAKYKGMMERIDEE